MTRIPFQMGDQIFDDTQDEEEKEIYENTAQKVREVRLNMDELGQYILGKKTGETGTFAEEYNVGIFALLNDVRLLTVSFCKKSQWI